MSAISCEEVDKVKYIQILKHVFFLASNGLHLFPSALYLNYFPVSEFSILISVGAKLCNTLTIDYYLQMK